MVSLGALDGLIPAVGSKFPRRLILRGENTALCRPSFCLFGYIGVAVFNERPRESLSNETGVHLALGGGTDGEQTPIIILGVSSAHHLLTGREFFERSSSGASAGPFRAPSIHTILCCLRRVDTE